MKDHFFPTAAAGANDATHLISCETYSVARFDEQNVEEFSRSPCCDRISWMKRCPRRYATRGLRRPLLDACHGDLPATLLDTAKGQ